VLKFAVPHGETHLPLRYFGLGFWAAAGLAAALLVTSLAVRPHDRSFRQAGTIGGAY
jgi:hypothetical protein